VLSFPIKVSYFYVESNIYELYKQGGLVSDEEVALIFEPESFKPLSEPMVNIRYNRLFAVFYG